MHISRIQINNFRNFGSVDIPVAGNVVLIGENGVGKSNFVFALRLVLDSTLSDSARLLKTSDVWDECHNAADCDVRIDLDLTNFDNDDALTALLTDYRIAEDYTTARLSYICRKQTGLLGGPRTDADYEFKLFGGNDEARSVSYQVRRRICLDLLSALRDAEAELATWRYSPLRPLLEDAFSHVSVDDLTGITNDLGAVSSRLVGLQPIRALEDNLRGQFANLAGDNHDIDARLAFAPTDAARMLQAVRVYIDNGRRGLSEASLGSANLALLTLKLAEFEWRRDKNERNFTVVAIEEPEAHLHPHLQRYVFTKLFETDANTNRSIIVTTHSPNLASVAPVRSIVLLKEAATQGTKAYSLAKLPLNDNELDDIERYLDVSRSEILFSRGVIFVEGDAEAALISVFAQSMDINLDERGITVCNVSGVNFRPYVRLACSLNLPFAVLTDWDPQGGTDPPLGKKRCIDILDDISQMRTGQSFLDAEGVVLPLDDVAFRTEVANFGLYVNEDTLETQIVRTPGLMNPLLEILDEHKFGPIRKKRITAWKADRTKIDEDQMMLMIGDISKGRFASRLASRLAGLAPPTYIRDAILHMVNND